jgi:hypothetical protein
MSLSVFARKDGNFLPSNGNALIACDSQFHAIAANFQNFHFDPFTNDNLLICASTEYQHLFTSVEPKLWVRQRASTKTSTALPRVWFVIRVDDTGEMGAGGGGG